MYLIPDLQIEAVFGPLPLHLHHRIDDPEYPVVEFTADT